MKKPTLIVGAIVVALAGIYIANQRGGQNGAQQEIVTNTDVPMGRSVETVSADQGTARTRAKPTTEQLDRYICHIAKEQCLYDPLSAASEHEAAWLIAHGYPSNAELSELAALSVDQLTAKAALGDTKAEVFLGKALISHGKPADGLGRLADASAKGNVYASYVLAEAHGKDGQLRNAVLSAAYYRLAYMQGDWKASAAASGEGAEFSPVETAMADRQAMTLYRNLLDEKGRSGYPLSISPRPD